MEHKDCIGPDANLFGGVRRALAMTFAAVLVSIFAWPVRAEQTASATQIDSRSDSIAEIPGFVYEDGRWTPNGPYEGTARAGSGVAKPFPAMPGLDANPLTPAKVELGRLLFFDPILSGDNRDSCATCHHPDLGLADARPLSMGLGANGVGPERTGGAELRRNAPTIWNAAFAGSQFWDGRAATLEEQLDGPLLDASEMNADPAEIVRELKAIPEYVRLFGLAFPDALAHRMGAADEAGAAKRTGTISFDNVKKALASFERTLISADSKFDQYAAGDLDAMDASEKKGMRLFRSLHARCFECHILPTFTDGTFRILGVPELASREASGTPPDLGRFEVSSSGREKSFRVPSLRNVARTAPYMHNGRFATLREVVDFYTEGGGRYKPAPPKVDNKIQRFELDDADKEALVAFLEALTDESLAPQIPASVPSGLAVVGRIETGAEALVSSADAGAEAGDEGVGNGSEATNVVFRVYPGQSIQAMIDRAIPGDTVEVMPGDYAGPVTVGVDGLSLLGLEIGGQRPVIGSGATPGSEVRPGAAEPEDMDDSGGALGQGVRVRAADLRFEGFEIVGPEPGESAP